MKNSLLPACLLALFSLSSCMDPRSWESSERIQQRGWAAPPETYHPETLFCYDTLGHKDCYAVPLSGGEGRVIASYESKYSRKLYSRERPLDIRPPADEDSDVDQRPKIKSKSKDAKK